jgi:peroxiredoxin
MEIVEISTKLGDFGLRDQNENVFRLSENRGRKILLSYHPLAWTSVCSEHMVSLENNFDRMKELNAVPVGISVDSVPCKRAWAESIDIEKTRLLSDFWPHGMVAMDHGVFREEGGTSERANIIVNEEGKVAFTKIYPMGEVPDIEEIIEVLETLP